MNGMILVLARIAARIPGLEPTALIVWRPIGSLKFKVAYRNACRLGSVCLHVGAGHVRLDGWLNTDITPLCCPLYLNAMRHLPIRDNSVSYIFGEHFINYMPRQATQLFFKECFRVLKPSGVLRITTIDIEVLARVYISNPDRVRLLNERNRQRGYQYNSYPIDILNKTFFEDGNVCEYDTQTLQQMFNAAGFLNITRCKVGESPHTALSGIERHDIGSVADEFTCAIEGIKPPL